jgi:hypothetical protein
MNYLSDDEDDKNELRSNQDQENQEEYDELEDEEMDDETRQIIFNNIKDEDDNGYMFMNKESVEKEKDKEKEKKTNKKKDLSFQDLLDKEKEKAPKKWTSSRAETKKPKTNVVKEEKRQFKPRLPPFKMILKEKKVEEKPIENNETNFPSLSTVQTKTVAKVDFKKLLQRKE